MPWTTPTLRDVRGLVRDAIRGSLPGADALIPNSVLRVLSDAQGALCHLTLQFIDWLALQLLPDTAETEWLDRHANIWLTNSDGTTGRKLATLASGVVEFTGVPLSILPVGTRLTGPNGIQYETLTLTTIGNEATPCDVRALDPGTIGNLTAGTSLNIDAPPTGLDNKAIVETMDGGVDTETDDQLRVRVLLRIQQPPMGGDAKDFVQWALAVPGVTRAWCYPLEQGIGTVTTRFMMDDLRAEWDGFPLPIDVENVNAYIDRVRPVAVKDNFVEAPIPFNLDLTIRKLTPDNDAMRAAIEASLKQMLLDKAAPGGTIYRAWVDEAIAQPLGPSDHFELEFETTPMPAPGYLATLGSVIYAG